MDTLPVIGISLGDPNGIGPEVSWKAARSPFIANTFKCVLIGAQEALSQLPGYTPLPNWDPASGSPPTEPMSLWDPNPELSFTQAPGEVHADAAKSAFAWIHAAVEACMAGHLDAMVTAPIHKAGFKKAGIKMPGHTELLAKETGTEKYAMLLTGGPLRVLTATRHHPLREVADMITEELVLDSIQLLHEARPWMAIHDGPIAVCALNPHAGDHGAIGMEEIDIIEPAIEKAKQRGYHVTGPLPADTVFHYAATGHYPAVISMYHDQGLGPLKMLAFDEGVNITLGLPIIRTSPDHGTAMDIAGRNKALPDSMFCAIETAINLTRVPNPWARDS